MTGVLCTVYGAQVYLKITEIVPFKYREILIVEFNFHFIFQSI